MLEVEVEVGDLSHSHFPPTPILYKPPQSLLHTTTIPNSTSSMANKLFLVVLFFCLANRLSLSVASFYNSVDVTWGGGRGKVLENGNLLILTLDQGSGSGFQSKQEYLYGRIDMQIKVVPGNSAGTVSTYYLSSQGPLHDEIDFEFLGNSSGEPYTLHTNVFSQGKGSREQQFRLWFDPRLTYHTYSILWNPNNIIFYVDNVPIRVFRNLEAKMGVPYPRSQPMRLYSSLWSADDWATQGGRVKTDWSKAPFVTSYRNLIANACPVSGPRTACGGAWMATTLDAAGQAKLRSVRQNNMIYDYCRDYSRFPNGFPPECSIQI